MLGSCQIILFMITSPLRIPGSYRRYPGISWPEDGGKSDRYIETSFQGLTRTVMVSIHFFIV